MSNATESNWYSTRFKTWQGAQLGAKPTAEMLGNVHNLGARPGKQALAIAMGLRPGGVTGAQIVVACGAPQLNKMRGFISDALLKREAAPPDANGHTVYKLAVTAKGQARIARTIKAKQAADEAGKGEAKPKVKKATGKPRKPAKPAPAETGDAPQVPAGDSPAGDVQPQA